MFNKKLTGNILENFRKIIIEQISNKKKIFNNYLTENILKFFRKIIIKQISNKKENVKEKTNRKFFGKFSKDNY